MKGVCLALAFATLPLHAAEIFLVRAAVCSSLRGPRLFAIDQRGTERRLRFQTRARCLEARRRLKPALEKTRIDGGVVFVTPTFDGRHRIVDVGAPSIDADPFAP